MAQVTLARGQQWLKPLPANLTPQAQTVLARYARQAKHNPRLELRAYLASGALGIHNPREAKGYTIRNTLSASLGVVYELNSKGNPIAKASKVRAYVCHNKAKGY